MKPAVQRLTSSHVTKLVAGAVVTLLVAGLLLQFPLRWGQIFADEPALTSMASVRNIEANYNSWKATYERSGGDRYLVLALGWSKGLSAEFTKAKGQARFDLIDKSVSIEVYGLPEESVSDVWLVDNQPGPERSVMPEPGDKMVRIGNIKTLSGVGRLQAELDRKTFANFNLDLVVVSREGENPGAGGILFGTPMLFQRLYHSARKGGLGVPIYPDHSPETAFMNASLGTNFVAALSAAPATLTQPNLAELIAAGENIFFNETFGGNGRTCGTCHPSENNFTIDPEFIARLPHNNPLFVAEFNPDLRQNFENPKLMRAFGLILENVDGFEDLANKFVMRGVPHTLALNVSIDSRDGPHTGWSGDGSSDGSLRLFANGAVKQHFTKTLNRVPGVDFRLPTDEELDALAAFMLSLGRQEDLTLPLPLKGFVASQGQEVFNDPTRGKCFGCHVNAGANVDPNIFGQGAGNLNFNTGVEDFLDLRGILIGETIPPDDGFGAPGNGEFNIPPLAEAADSGPFFHNNLFTTIEGAVAFYNTDAFNDSPAGQLLVQATGSGINLNVVEIVQVAGFLRVINALENIRFAIDYLQRAKQADPAKFLRLGIADIKDGSEVLGILHADAQLRLVTAKIFSEIAVTQRNGRIRNALINRAISLVERARGDIIDDRGARALTKADVTENENAIAALKNAGVIRQLATTIVNEIGREFDHEQIRHVLNDLAIEGLVDEFDKLVGKQLAASDAGSLPESYALDQNHPNPFNPETEIRFQLPEANHVVVKIFDALGQEIRTLADGQYGAGYHSVRWDGKDHAGNPMSSGIYFYQLRVVDPLKGAGNFSQVKKMNLLK